MPSYRSFREKARRGWEIYSQEGLRSFLSSFASYLKYQLSSRLRSSYLFNFPMWLRRGKLVWKKDGTYVLTGLTGDEEFYSPDVKNLDKSRESTVEKYYPNDRYVSIDQSDVVVEVGSFIGASTEAAARKAAHVYALEPVSRNRRCLEKNIEGRENVTVLPYAVGEENRTETINIAKKRSKSSLLSLDWSPDYDRNVVGAETVEVRTLEWICDELELDEVDYLRVEAEGYEPEIIAGIGDATVRKVTVNCSEEREGESPMTQVVSKLREMGYDVQQEGWNVYAKLTPADSG